MSAAHFLPDTNWEPTAEFWAGAAQGELRIPRCRECGTYNWYPPKTCHHCGSPQLRWEAVSGRGTLFSWAVVRHVFVKAFEEEVPYVTGLVALEEDPAVRIVTRIVDCLPEEVGADMRVEAVFRPLVFSGSEKSVVVPWFRPATV